PEEIARVSRECTTHRNDDVLLRGGDRLSGSIHPLPGHDRRTRAVRIVKDLDLTEPRHVGDPHELDRNVRAYADGRTTRESGRSSRQGNRDKEYAPQHRHRHLESDRSLNIRSVIPSGPDTIFL